MSEGAGDGSGPVFSTHGMLLLLVLLVLGAGVVWLLRPRFGRSTRSPANETAAIATLRNLHSAQLKFQEQRFVDLDADGIGEFGTLAELTGTLGPRLNSAGSKRGPAPLNPAPGNPVLSRSMTPTQPGGEAGKAGYFFKVFLAGSSTDGVCDMVSSPNVEMDGSFTSPVNTDFAERVWCAYAWPIRWGNSGNRAFFINQDGVVLSTGAERRAYSGSLLVPKPLAAFHVHEGYNLERPIAAGTTGRDGRVWKVIR